MADNQVQLHDDDDELDGDERLPLYKRLFVSYTSLSTSVRRFYNLSFITIFVLVSAVIYLFSGSPPEPVASVDLRRNTQETGSRADDTPLPDTLNEAITVDSLQDVEKGQVQLLDRDRLAAKKLYNQRKEEFLANMKGIINEQPSGVGALSKKQTEPVPDKTSKEKAVTSQEAPKDTPRGDIAKERREIELLATDTDYERALSDVQLGVINKVLAKRPEMGASVSYQKVTAVHQPSISTRDNTIGGVSEASEGGGYNGDDFLPGRKILARLDGLVTNEEGIPYIRLRPLEGPLANGGLFLATPQEVENGFVITTQKLTWKSYTGSFQAVAVSVDERNSPTLASEVIDRQFYRNVLIFSSGILQGFNTLAQRVGSSVIVNGDTVTTDTEIDKEALLVSGAGGVGQAYAGRLDKALDEAKDIKRLYSGEIVALMIIEKPALNWLPDMDNEMVY